MQKTYKNIGTAIAKIAHYISTTPPFLAGILLLAIAYAPSAYSQQAPTQAQLIASISAETGASIATVTAALNAGNPAATATALTAIVGGNAAQVGTLVNTLSHGNSAVAASILTSMAGGNSAAVGGLISAIGGGNAAATGAILTSLAGGNGAAVGGLISSISAGNPAGVAGTLTALAGGNSAAVGGLISSISGGDPTATVGILTSLAGGNGAAVSGLISAIGGGNAAATGAILTSLAGGNGAAVGGLISSISAGNPAGITGTLTALAGGNGAAVGSLVNGITSGNASETLGVLTSLAGGNGAAVSGLISSISAGNPAGVAGTLTSMMGGNGAAIGSLVSAIGGGNVTGAVNVLTSLAGGNGAAIGGLISAIGGGNASTAASILTSMAGGSGAAISSLVSAIGGGDSAVIAGTLSAMVGGDGALAGSLIKDLSGGNPAALINAIAGGNVAAMLSTLGAGNIAGMLKSMGGAQIAGLLNALGGGNVAQIGALLNSLAGGDIAQVSALLNSIGGGNVGALLSSLGGSDVAGLLNALSGGNPAALLTKLGISSIASITGGNDPDPHDPCPTVSCSSTATVLSSQSASFDNRYTDIQPKGAVGWISNTAPYVDMGSNPVNQGIQGSMPPSSMPVKTTPAMSIVENFPWYWKDIDAGTQPRVYNGIGAQTYLSGPVSINLEPLAFPDNPNAQIPTNIPNPINAASVSASQCQPLTLNGCSHDPTTFEQWKRLNYDSCTNQHILPLDLQVSQSPSLPGLQPVAFSGQLRNYQQTWNESVCQPLRLYPPGCVRDLMNGGGCKKDVGSSDGNLYDYRAWGYLERAWQDVLGGQTIQLTSGAQASNATAGIPPVTVGTGNIVTPSIGSGGSALGWPFTHDTPAFGAAYGVTNKFGIGYGSNGNAGGTYTGLLLSIADLANLPFERIVDPTHPFSPRWDWKGKDRDYSTGANGHPNPLLNGTPGTGYDVPTGSQCVVRCAALPVDIMNFRSQEFDACMSKRIELNTQCFWTQVKWLAIPMPSCVCTPFYCPIYSYLPPQSIDMTVNDILPMQIHPDDCLHQILSPDALCKTYYAKKSQWPVCSTKYDFPADGDNPDYCKPARDIIGDPSPPSKGVKKCCDDLAQALTPLNTLKIRNTRMDSSLNPVPAGYSYNSYFKAKELPFMRWWDTGTSAGGNNGDATRNYDPNCDLGYSDVIVGVGVEGHSCKYGGTGGAAAYSSCVNIPAVDPLTTWEELKAYQLQSVRNFGLNCLVQYEKQYKILGTEDGALGASGATALLATPGDSDAEYQLQNLPWHLSWRGYLSDTNTSTRFPCFGGSCGAGSITGGLNNAQPGDIIYFYHSDVTSWGIQAMPFMGVVKFVGTGTASDGSTPNNYVTFIEVNDGKYPDACGVTNMAGSGQERTMYETCIPLDVANNYYPAGTSTACGTTTNPYSWTSPVLNSAGSCNDPLTSVCTFANPAVWSGFRIYRPSSDVRN